MALPFVQMRSLSRFAKVVSYFCLGAVVLSLCSCSQESGEDATESEKRFNEWLAEQGIERIPAQAFEFPPFVDASELRSTVVASDLTTELSAGMNVVYCATRKFAESFEKQSSAATGSPTSTQRIADELPVGSYRVLHGTADEILSQLAEDFPSTSESFDALRGEAHWWGCHFQRSLPFPEAFEPLKEPLLFYSATGTFKVACFGDRRFDESTVQQTLRKEQITVIDFQNEDDFIVRLNTAVDEDELILAKVPQEQSLESTVELVMKRVQRNPLQGTEQAEIQDGEALVVPMLTVNTLSWFSEAPPGFQTIRFRLDEKGAVIDSFLGYLNLGTDVVLRQMVFDKPFLLYLKSKTADVPYFVLWVENLEVMEEFVAEADG